MDQARNCLCQKELRRKHWSPVAPWSFAITSSMRTPRYISRPTTINTNGTGLPRFRPSHQISNFYTRSPTSNQHQEVSSVSPTWSRRLKRNRIESSFGRLFDPLEASSNIPLSLSKASLSGEALRKFWLCFQRNITSFSLENLFCCKQCFR